MLRWKPRSTVGRFAYRARSPLFDGMRFELCAAAVGEGARVWAEAPAGPVAMDGDVAL